MEDKFQKGAHKPPLGRQALDSGQKPDWMRVGKVCVDQEKEVRCTTDQSAFSADRCQDGHDSGGLALPAQAAGFHDATEPSGTTSIQAVPHDLATHNRRVAADGAPGAQPSQAGGAPIVIPPTIVVSPRQIWVSDVNRRRVLNSGWPAYDREINGTSTPISICLEAL